jgi:hypothetical protein
MGKLVINNDVPDSYSKGEAMVEASASKKHQGWPMNVGHFHESASPTHFWKVVLTPGLESILIPDVFREHMSAIPKEIVLRTNISCYYRVKLRHVNGRLSID